MFAQKWMAPASAENIGSITISRAWTWWRTACPTCLSVRKKHPEFGRNLRKHRLRLDTPNGIQEELICSYCHSELALRRFLDTYDQRYGKLGKKHDPGSPKETKERRVPAPVEGKHASSHGMLAYHGAIRAATPAQPGSLTQTQVVAPGKHTPLAAYRLTTGDLTSGTTYDLKGIKIKATDPRNFVVLEAGTAGTYSANGVSVNVEDLVLCEHCTADINRPDFFVRLDLRKAAGSGVSAALAVRKNSSTGKDGNTSQAVYSCVCCGTDIAHQLSTRSHEKHGPAKAKARMWDVHKYAHKKQVH